VPHNVLYDTLWGEGVKSLYWIQEEMSMVSCAQRWCIGEKKASQLLVNLKPGQDVVAEHGRPFSFGKARMRIVTVFLYLPN
jgi:hypothetical protein